MNSKAAKFLRKLAGYDNQTKTPGRMGFPGIAHFTRLPVFEKRVTTKTTSARIYDVELGRMVWAKLSVQSERHVSNGNRYIGGRLGWANYGKPIFDEPKLVFRQIVDNAETGDLDVEGKELGGERWTPHPLTKMARLDQKDAKQQYRIAKKYVEQHGMPGFLAKLEEVIEADREKNARQEFLGLPDYQPDPEVA